MPSTSTDPVEAAAAPLGFRRQVRLIMRGVRSSPVSKRLTVLIVAIVVVVIVTAYGQIRLNQWNKPFFDALSRRDLRDFMYQLGVFAIIASAILILNVGQRWLVETFKYKLREGLVRDLLNHWMLPRRAFWLANAGPMGVNPDQRMHEDARKLCDLSTDLGVGLFQATILFGTFAGVLWALSTDFSFRINGTDYAVPGFMLWTAVIYAALGSLLSSWVGRSLIDRNEVRYEREADLRFSLVRINEHLDDISLARGEEDEKRRVELHLRNVLAACKRLVSALTNLTWVTAGFGWITIVAPTLAAAPLYFAGKISFGGLMMAAAAFLQAQSSLRWFVDNFSVIADWRATLLRVASFRYALTTTEETRDVTGRHITYAEGEPGTMKIEDFEVQSSSGCDVLREKSVTITSGQRVLIVGAPGTSKTLLFRALAGLWPWGSGSVTRPQNEQIFFLPRGTPYLPRGTLREVLAYPMKVDGFDQQAFAHALSRLGLERLVPLLDQTQRWDRELSLDEQLGLAFARILLLAPRWLLMDDAFGSLEDEAVERVIDVFNKELAHTSIIHIGRAAQARDPIFTHVLHLVPKASVKGSLKQSTGAHS